MKKYPLNKRQQQMVQSVHDRWIEERVKGYRGTDGVWHAPMTPDDAQRQWDERNNTAKFEQVVFDPEIIQKMQMDKDEPIPVEAIVDWNTVKHLFEAQNPAEAPTLAEGATVSAPPKTE